MGIIEGILAVLGMGADWLKRKQEEQAKAAERADRIAEAETQARIDRLAKGQAAEIDWDKSAVDQMQHSWKDEWFTLLLSIPAILAFTGKWGVEVVTAGFAALDTMPEWYIKAFLLAIAASFGWRKLVDVVNRVTAKKTPPQ